MPTSTASIITRLKATLKNANFKRYKWLIALIIIAVLMTTIGIVIGLNVKSSEMQKAETAPPTPSDITATVEKKTVENSIITRGQITAADELRLGYGELTQEDDTTKGTSADILTDKFVNVGDTIKEGQKILEIDGRPVILLQGAKPAYRTMKSGDNGYDVGQLQASLRRLGYLKGTQSNTFDDATNEAITKFYQALGYDVAQSEQTSEKLGDSPQGTSTGSGNSGGNGQAGGSRSGTTPSEPTKTTTISVPKTEIMFVPNLPLHLLDIASSIGYAIPNVLAKVSTSNLKVLSKLNADDCKSITDKVPAKLYADENSPIDATSDGLCDANSSISFSPQNDIDYSLFGKDIKVVITTSKSASESLVVPLSAIFSNSQGETFIIKVNQKSDKNDTTEQHEKIKVKIGTKNAEECEISMLEDKKLDVRDKVLVGQNAN